MPSASVTTASPLYALLTLGEDPVGLIQTEIVPVVSEIKSLLCLFVAI